MNNIDYKEIKLIFINYIIKSFRMYGVYLTQNQAYLAYHNYSREKCNVDWDDKIRQASFQGVVSKLKDYIPKNKLKYLS